MEKGQQVKPCSECNGSGEKMSYYDDPNNEWGEDQVVPCPRCGGTPRLVCSDAYPERAWCGGRGWFTPDPDSVMRWCDSHDSRQMYDTTLCLYAWAAWDGDGEPKSYDCEWVWVAVPELLEEA